MNDSSKLLVVALCSVACLQAGCRSTLPAKGESADGEYGPFGKVANPMEWGAASDEPRSGSPERVVATWVDTVRQQVGSQPERGFGGRLYFYDRAADPITVDGRLVVYAFDEQDRAPTDHKPTRRYVFPAEQLTLHMSETEIGPSYSFWLPWGSVDGPSTEISLIARFEPTRGGGLVVSDQARQRLPGHGLAPTLGGKTQLAQASGAERVEQAGYQQQLEAPAKEPEEPRKRLTTTTIRLGR